jgi:hypothetical protein
MSGNYVNKLLEFAGEQNITPGLTVVNVFHDGWCAVFKGKPCNCDPEIEAAGTQPKPRNLA